MSDFIKIEERDKKKFSDKMIEYVDKGYEIVNYVHNANEQKFHGHLSRRDHNFRIIK